MEDRRQDYPLFAQEHGQDVIYSSYPPSPMTGTLSDRPGSDLMPQAKYMLGWNDPGAYGPSFSPNMAPPRSVPTLPANSRMGPQMPQNMPRVGQAAGLGDYTDSKLYDENYLPPIGSHLPYSPGDPGWTAPPSLSGPHNRGGDPNRPGYGAAIGDLGMTLNSVPQGWQ